MNDPERGKISANISLFRMYAEKKDHDLAGVLVNDYYGFRIDYSSVGQLFSYLDEFLDYVNFPMAATRRRTFGESAPEKREAMPEHVKDVEDGAIPDRQPDFILHVQFRQGATWQGTLRRADRQTTRRFRSELELITLIMNALDIERGKDL
ncbi:hypothetical protein [Bacilliculturomica massiliensis]|uniref:hypothetical protein n=1 Tax=Bacilliculturomica massiliensis TaxID=1917867 RepID=UPI001FE3B063|nr:hypothetical protein [Bacilliculturomica massiliensis]